MAVGQLKDFGFSCSLDDFGNGYSSFSVLTNTDLTVMKIDRSLFRDVSNPRERILLSHILQTANELNLETVAEGVEDRQYIDFLRKLGCDYVQGFVFYRPMPAEEFEERFLIRNEKIDLDSLERVSK
ncbi:EAL domain-containing protein [Murimonas intestini]|uniref:EAL domain-containing protein n=1 Tax=Murimonas intestini TaxID=1337051 RepID=UPI0027D46D83|nr:EAL domain-containing protein [Murimonas intestini]